MTIFYYPDNSDVENSRDILDSFEEDLVSSFTSFIKQEYAVEIQVKWVNVGKFSDILKSVESGSHGDFGVSTISITKERAERVKFSKPYLADIQVLVSNNSFELANTSVQLRELLNKKKAISIPNTTLESGLFNLRSSQEIDFTIEYVTNTGEMIEAIADTPNSFGYVDLANFLVSFKNLEKLKRQLFFPIKLEGVGMIYPMGSDWEGVVTHYFESERFLEDRKELVTKYFGAEIGMVLNEVAKSKDFGIYQEIIVSNREKEIQNQELRKTLIREREHYDSNQNLLIILAVVGLAGAILLVSYRMKTQVNRVLLEQQETIEQRNNELKKLNEEKNELIKVLAHDLRSPLSNIQGCSLMLSEDKSLQDDSAKMIDIIGDASNRIKSMISKILDVEAIESGNRNLQLEIVSPDLVIQQIIHQNSDKARRKKITVKLLEGPNLKVLADRFYLVQVLENLLLNALKFSNENSEVFFEVKKYEDKVRIVIQDQGPGISDEDKQKVFKKFARLSAKPTGGEESVGLGLSIVKKYTEMMGGGVSFETELGMGTSFFVDLKQA